VSDRLLGRQALVLRPLPRAFHGVGLEITDRSGTVLATVREPVMRPRLFSWDGFGDRRTRANKVLVSLPDGVPIFFIYKQWAALRRPVRIWDGGGGLLGTVDNRSTSLSSWELVIADAHAQHLGRIHGPAEALTVTDSDGETIAEILKEGEAQVLIVRAEIPGPLHGLLAAAFVTTRLVMRGSRQGRFT
jgi:hypothetical protein